jgi:NADH oxidoreductase Hcr
VPDIANRTVMTCGPAPYMDIVEEDVKALGVTRFFKEQFFTPVAEAATSGMKFTKLQPAQTFFGRGHHAAGSAGKQQGAGGCACRAGVRLL